MTTAHQGGSDMVSPSVSNLRLPGGDYPQSFVPEVASREKVPTMVCLAIAIPLPVREREAIVERTADVAQLGRREEPIDGDAMLAVPEAFVFHLPSELAHRGIPERLGQLGSRKALDVQVLDAGPVVMADQLGGQLVKEIPP